MKDFLLKLVQILIPLISPTLKDLLHDSVIKLYHKAKESENKFDDAFILLLMYLLDIPEPRE